MAAFSRIALEQNIAAVVVGFPATNVLGARARFCMSSTHTIAELQEAIHKIQLTAKLCLVDYLDPELSSLNSSKSSSSSTSSNLNHHHKTETSDILCSEKQLVHVMSN